MRTLASFASLSIVALLAGWPSLTPLAQSPDSTGASPSAFVGDLYEAGGSVRVASEIDGDVVIAGGTLSVSEAVSRDVMAAGGLITISADTGDDLRLAGGSVTIHGDVGSDLTAAGGIVTLESVSTVRGKARLAGQVVQVFGNVDGDVHATGGRITLAGSLGGNVEIDADSIELEPGTVIRGNLTYAASNEIVIGEGAVIEGEVERLEFKLGQVESWGPALASTLKSLLSLILSAAVLILLFPRFTLSAVDRANDSVLKTLALGLAVMASSAVLILVVLFSGLATAFALTALGLYLALLFGGWLVGVIWLGHVTMQFLNRTPGASKWTRLGSVVVAALILAVVGAIPYAGFLSVFLTTLIGIGGTSLHLKALYAR